MTILLFHRVAAYLAQLVQARLSPFTFLVNLSLLSLLTRLLLSLNVSSFDLLLSSSTTLQELNLHLHPAFVKSFLILLANLIILTLFFSWKGAGSTGGRFSQAFSDHLEGKFFDFSAEDSVLFNGPRPIPSAPPRVDLPVPSAPPMELFQSPATSPSASQLLSVDRTATPSVDFTGRTPLSRNESHSHELEKVPVAQDIRKSRKASVTASSPASPSNHVDLLHTYSPAGRIAKEPVAQDIEKSTKPSVASSSPASPVHHVELLHTQSPDCIAQDIEKSKKASTTSSSPTSPGNHVELLHTHSPGCIAKVYLAQDAEESKKTSITSSSPASPSIHVELLHTHSSPGRIAKVPVAQDIAKSREASKDVEESKKAIITSSSPASTRSHVELLHTHSPGCIPKVPVAQDTQKSKKASITTSSRASPSNHVDLLHTYYPGCMSSPRSDAQDVMNLREYAHGSLVDSASVSAPSSPLHINQRRFVPSIAGPPVSCATPSTAMSSNHKRSTPTITVPPPASSAPSSPVHTNYRSFAPPIALSPVVNSAPASPLHISHGRSLPTIAALANNSRRKGLFRHKSDLQSSTRAADTYPHIGRTVSCTHYYEFAREESCSVGRLYTASVIDELTKEEANECFSEFTFRKWASIRGS